MANSNKRSYEEFEYIKAILNNDDILKILKEPLAKHFTQIKMMEISKNPDLFFDEFQKINDESKYKDFIAVSKDISDWIPKLLSDDEDAVKSRTLFKVNYELLHVQPEEIINNLPMSEVFLHDCWHSKIFTDNIRDKLIAVYTQKGSTIAKYQFLWDVNLKSTNCYGKLLVLLHKYKTNYISKCCDELQKSIDDTQEEDVENLIMGWAASILEHNMNLKNIEPVDNNVGNIESDATPGSLVIAGSDAPQAKEIPQEGANNIEYDDPKKEPVEKEFHGPEAMDTDRLCNQDGTGDMKETFYSALSSLSNNGDRTSVKETFQIASTSSSNNNGSQTKNNDQDLSDEGDSDTDSDGDVKKPNISKMDYLFGALSGKKVNEILSTASSVRKEGPKKDDLEVRSYQQELVDEGIKGRNVLICAPTGSGKTIVAVKIVEEHLQSTKNAKVAFVVHRIALVEQQYAQFSRYLTSRITRLSGSVKTTSTPLIGHIPCFDVFVMTSDILRNALEQDNETKLPSLGAFTMILFDECHNCDKKHPYNRIMNHYFRSKEEGKSVPQIIGLTASTGTNKANTMQKAMKRLYTLCANLDCYTVSTVKLYVDELKKNQSVPGEEIIAAAARTEDNFETLLQTQMRKCEEMLLQMNVRDFFPKDPETQLLFSIPEDRMHQKYAGFVGKLETKLLNNTKPEHEGREAIYAITQYLNAFVRALTVNHLFRAEDAINVIKEYLRLDTNSQTTCQVEKVLRRGLRKLERGHLMQMENPCLQMLKNKITEQLDRDNQSRIIVFVRERSYTQILKDVFTSLGNPKIKCDTIVGNTISAEKGGLTQNEMEEVLGRFRKGQCNVLFSTTVAEEGLDVQKCNLVIRYGHVTNETAMVQSRGRARALESKYLVIVPNRFQWQINKENINKYRESMMYKAIEKFQTMKESERNEQIEECQFERQLLEIVNKTSKISLKTNSDSTIVRLFFCKKCNKNICESSDIRVAEDAHHIVINTDVFDRMTVNVKNNQILCANCGNHLGNRQSYKGHQFPNLTISSFTLTMAGDDSAKLSTSYKKWKDVDFVVKNVTNKELLNFSASHSLSS